MAQFFAPTQILNANNAVAFNGKTKRCCNVVHNDGSGLFTLHGGSCCNPAKYIVHLHVVITAVTAAPKQFELYIDGEPVAQSLISLVPAAIGDVLSGDVTISVESTCGCTKLAVHTLTTADLTSAVINIDRVA